MPPKKRSTDGGCSSAPKKQKGRLSKLEATEALRLCIRGYLGTRSAEECVALRAHCFAEDRIVASSAAARLPVSTQASARPHLQLQLMLMRDNRLPVDCAIWQARSSGKPSTSPHLASSRRF